MELRTFNRDKGPILAAVVALLALGLGSMFLTWQNISRQRDLVDQHMQLAGGAVVHGVEAASMRVALAAPLAEAANKACPASASCSRK